MGLVVSLARRARQHRASALPQALPAAARRQVHRLPHWQRRWLYLDGVALIVSGALWLALHYSVGAGAGAMPHPLEAWAMRLHGVAAFGALFMLGVLAGGHAPIGWRMSRRYGWRRQRALGVTLCAAGAALAVSGYALYYFAPEWLRPALGWTHALIGAAMALLIVLHRRRGAH